jgi:hypothetical protein
MHLPSEACDNYVEPIFISLQFIGMSFFKDFAEKCRKIETRQVNYLTRQVCKNQVLHFLQRIEICFFPHSELPFSTLAKFNFAWVNKRTENLKFQF